MPAASPLPSAPARPAPGIAALLPLLVSTGVGLLATDLYLPSVPSLPAALGGTTGEAQETLVVFLLAFSVLQLVYGALADAWGRFRVLRAAAALFLLGSAACAAAHDMGGLLRGRLLQAVGAAAGAAIVPAVIRGAYGERDSVRMLSWLGVGESVIPAAGPFVGAAILHLFGWRANFVVLTGVALLACVLLQANRRVYDGDKPAGDAPSPGALLRNAAEGYAALCADRAYLGYVVGQAAAYGALLTFVGAAPFLLQAVYGGGPAAFGTMQAVLVSVFMAGSLSAGRVGDRLGARRTIGLGVALLLLSAALLGTVAAGLLPGGGVALTLAMLPSQYGIGVRYGVGIGRALGRHPGREASAAALFSFLCFAAAALGNGIAAPLLETHGLAAAALPFGGFALLSAGMFLLLPRER